MINLAMADLLDNIADDMDDEAAFGNAGSHWHAALTLARVINGNPCPMCGRYGCEPKHHMPIATFKVATLGPVRTNYWHSGLL